MIGYILFDRDWKMKMKQTILYLLAVCIMLTSCNNIKKTLMTTPEAIDAPIDITIDITKDKDCPEEYRPELDPSKDFGERLTFATTITVFALVAVPLVLLSYWASPDSQPQ